MPIRTQADGLNEIYSVATAIDCSNLPDMARQEFKDETDVNKLLARYGVEAMMRGEPQYAEIDYTMDLQQSLESIREAERAIAKLPVELRTKYSTWERLLDGAYNGEFKTDLTAYHEAKAMETAAAAQVALDRQGASS